MTSLLQRRQVIALVGQATQAGARQERACAVICLSERTLQRWQREQCRADLRPARVQAPTNRLSESERQAVLAVANSHEFGHLAPSQIVPRLVDRGEYIASESTFYRVLRAARQLGHRSAQRPDQPRSKPRAVRHGAQRVVQLGHHVPAHAGRGALLLPVPVPRHLQPQDCGLAGL